MKMTKRTTNEENYAKIVYNPHEEMVLYQLKLIDMTIRQLKDSVRKIQNDYMSEDKSNHLRDNIFDLQKILKDTDLRKNCKRQKNGLYKNEIIIDGISFIKILSEPWDLIPKDVNNFYFGGLIK